MVHRKPLSVGQVAEILHVSNKSILNWIHAEALKAFTTFGGHYRIWPADLKCFLITTKMRVPFEYVDERQPTILIIDDDEKYSESLQSTLCREMTNTNVIASRDGYEGILMIGEHHPHLLILALGTLNEGNHHILELLKNRKEKNGMKIMLLCDQLESSMRLRYRNSIVDCTVEKHSGIKEVLSSVSQLITTEVESNSNS